MVENYSQMVINIAFVTPYYGAKKQRMLDFLHKIAYTLSIIRKVWGDVSYIDNKAIK
jgi:hypothetical protein